VRESQQVELYRLKAIRHMEPIGLIAAMTQESGALLRCIKESKAFRVGAYHSRSFEIAGQTCVMVTSGMGTQRASEAAQTLIETVSPRCLISFGIAGAVETELEIGDVVAAEAVCRLERGRITPQQQLEPWTQAAREAASRTLAKRGAHLYIGTAITTGGSQVSEGQLGVILHPILEMETAGIAQVAAEHGIPLLSIRAISDGPRAPLPIDPVEMMDENARLRPGGIFMAIMRRPSIIRQFGRMLQNTRIAADNAALVLIEVLRNLNSDKDNR
jgi:adenosylhomocysteine nucleosidase